MLSQEDRWNLMKAFFSEKGLVRQHLDSYNEFIGRSIQQIVDEIEKIEPDIPGFYVKLGKVEVGEPTIREADGAVRPVTPMEARIRNLTYYAPLWLEMTPVDLIEGVEVPGETANIYIGRLPVMLKSNKCLEAQMSPQELVEIGEDPSDPGGYFIINGSERVLVTQEDLAPNKILIEESSSGKTSTHITKVFSTARGFRAPVTVERRNDGSLRVSFPSVPRKIPLATVLRALGLETDKSIVDAISNRPEVIRELIPTIREATEIKNIDDALDYIGKRVAVGQMREYRIKRAQQVLDKYLLPHVGTLEEDRKKKAYFLSQMAQRILELFLNIRNADDKDHYANKRLKLAGDLLTSLFRVAFLNLVRDITYQLERTAVRGKKPNIKTAVRADVITERLRHALATGNWVGGKAGVSQLLDRTNYMSTLSHLRRVVSPLSRSQPHFEARDLHPTHWGKICPNETPEGPNCGLVKNLALMAYISVGLDEHIVEEILRTYGVKSWDELQGKEANQSRVFLNGRLIGYHPNPSALVDQIKKARRANEIDESINVAYYHENDEIKINCDIGRVRRPVMIVENGQPKITPKHVEKLVKGELKWTDLILNGLIEYLDAEEEENVFIAIDSEELTPSHTHLEIDISTILGICASIIPFPQHNQSPRNTYEAGMSKQALGLYAKNFQLRVDTRGHFLHYPQVPLVKTRAMDVIDFDKCPAGQNFVVGILSHGGYNMEDALIINKASLERGLARSSFFRCYDVEEKRYPGGQEDRFEIPGKNVRGYRVSEAYRHLADDGLIEPETDVTGGDVIIGRTSPPRFLEEYTEFEMPAPIRRETSISLRHGERGVIDTVIVTETVDGNRLVKVRVRDQRIPELGDKFASRHGQKGVLGIVVRQEDMPFTEDGIVPDLIVNPHAIPSRMTVGQIIETIASKVGCIEGERKDGTAFSGSEETIQKEMRDAGFDHRGLESMYNGMTGEKFEVDIFIGVVYYQRLHHMVADKLHARARGPVQILTRQPTEGRAREGGLRFGEMERDCLIGHGAALLLKERLLDESDKTVVIVCDECGMLAVQDRSRDRFYCPICGDKTTVSRVTMSYAFKLLLQELMSLGISPRLRLKEPA